jgi:ribosome-binding protein aMBF1 (putative translation factor)
LQPFDEAFAQVRIEETYDKDANLVKRVENGRKFLISLGCRIRNCRLSRGWTQEDLSERAGLSAKYIGEVERGEKNPTYLVLVQIADAIGIKPREFF